MSKGQSLQDPFLNALRREHLPGEGADLCDKHLLSAERDEEPGEGLSR